LFSTKLRDHVNSFVVCLATMQNKFVLVALAALLAAVGYARVLRGEKDQSHLNPSDEAKPKGPTEPKFTRQSHRQGVQATFANADKNNDGVLTFEEFRKKANKNGKEDEEKAGYRAYFDSADANHDGVVSLAEATKHSEAHVEASLLEVERSNEVPSHPEPKPSSATSVTTLNRDVTMTATSTSSAPGSTSLAEITNGDPYCDRAYCVGSPYITNENVFDADDKSYGCCWPNYRTPWCRLSWWCQHGGCAWTWFSSPVKTVQACAVCEWVPGGGGYCDGIFREIDGTQNSCANTKLCNKNCESWSYRCAETNIWHMCGWNLEIQCSSPDAPAIRAKACVSNCEQQ
jgi:hypothetical protein